MRLRTLNTLILAALCCLFCLCAGSEFIKKSPNEIDKYLQDNPDLPEADKTCLEEGRFEIGILKETVFFLLGEPGEKKVVKEKWAKQEYWIYRKGGKKTFIIEDNHVVGILENK
jgi:hypothetical protein